MMCLTCYLNMEVGQDWWSSFTAICEKFTSPATGDSAHMVYLPHSVMPYCAAAHAFSKHRNFYPTDLGVFQALGLQLSGGFSLPGDSNVVPFRLSYGFLVG